MRVVTPFTIHTKLMIHQYNRDIVINGSRHYIIIPDITNTLLPTECVVPFGGGRSLHTLASEALLLRNPCYDPSEVLHLTVANPNEAARRAETDALSCWTSEWFAHQVNCVIVSTQAWEGRRPVADLMQGADFDGDMVRDTMSINSAPTHTCNPCCHFTCMCGYGGDTRVY